MNTAPRIAHKARRVTVVVVNHRIVLICEVADLIELRDGAIHRKNTVCGDQDSSRTLVSRGLQLGLEVGHVAVAIAVARGFAESHTIDD